MLYPLKFHPIFKERVWGGRSLESLYGKPLPPEAPIGESWEVCDRNDDQSIVANGPLAGRSLRWLMENHGSELLGFSTEASASFPLLLKILDAQDRLSLQVHPPASVAAALGGDPKTEMWYIAHAHPGAELYAGLKPGTTKEGFEQAIQAGTVADCFHRIGVQNGDALFLPSGRVHAIGAGNVIFEVQQNSDTTYRVFDWNRPGTDGKPRTLHVHEAMQSIDFNDFEPKLISTAYAKNADLSIRYLVHDPLFTVDSYRIRKGHRFYMRIPTCHVMAITRGEIDITCKETSLTGRPGDFILLPASVERVAIQANSRSEALVIQTGQNL